MKILPAILSALLACSTWAQQSSYLSLDHNNVSCLLDDEGGFFNNLPSGLAGYEVPKQSGLSTIFAGSYWMGAQDVNGALYMSAVKYSAGGSWSAFHGGPISTTQAYNTLAYSNQYQDAIWKVSKAEILAHQANVQNLGYVVPAAIANWPGNGDTSLGIAAQLAPFIDLNGNGLYEPSLGDYPDIRGDEAVYVITNDESYLPDGNQLGIEVHAMFYQFQTANYLNNTTFLTLRVYNRSNRTYYNFHEGLYLDFDLGNYSDDYIGCDPTNRLLYAYNGDDLDESDGGQLGYGANPPCQGVLCLSHPLESAGRLTGAMDAGMSTSFDTTAWLLMNGQNSDSTNWMNPLTNASTHFLYDGNPNVPNTWNEAASNNPAGDRRGMLSIREAILPQGESFCADFAFIYNRSGNRLQNVQQNIYTAGALLTWYAQDQVFPCQSQAFNSVTESDQALEPLHLYPNPTSQLLTVAWTSKDASCIEIFTLHGKLVERIPIHEPKAQTLDVSALSPGMYLIRVGEQTQCLHKE
jgi:hypothetical protein